MSFLPQRIGAATMIACFIAGQTLCALFLDHWGAFGLPHQDISAGRLLGMGFIIGGVLLVRLV
jgi:transporter family-2 protein